jgi:hypothetical protein
VRNERTKEKYGHKGMELKKSLPVWGKGVFLIMKIENKPDFTSRPE